MMQINLELIGGLAFGIEHVTGEEDDFFDWAIPIHFGFFRFVLIRVRDEE